MRPLQSFAVLLAAIFLIFIGSMCLAISLNIISFDTFNFYYNSYSLQKSVALTGAILLLTSVLMFMIIFGSSKKERTIAFNTPDGEVAIALSAIENFIKKLGSQMPEIKDMRSSVVASKKGVAISATVSLWADANIPDITEKIQNTIKTKVQDMLGIEEPIITKVHVTKIAHRDVPKSKKVKGEPQEEVSPEPPYRNF